MDFCFRGYPNFDSTECSTTLMSFVFSNRCRSQKKNRNLRWLAVRVGQHPHHCSSGWHYLMSQWQALSGSLQATSLISMRFYRRHPKKFPKQPAGRKIKIFRNWPKAETLSEYGVQQKIKKVCLFVCPSITLGKLYVVKLNVYSQSFY